MTTPSGAGPAQPHRPHYQPDRDDLSPSGRYVVDPAWGLSPAEYARVLRAADAGASPMAPALFVIAGLVMIPGVVVLLRSGPSSALVFLLAAALAAVAGVACQARDVAEAREHRRLLDRLAALPDDVTRPIPFEALAALERSTLVTLVARLEAGGADALDRADRADMRAAVHRYAVEHRRAPGTYDVDLDRSGPERLGVPPSEGGAGARSEGGFEDVSWTRARRRFERVRDEWTELVTDPLNALDHAALFDVTQPRTAAFVDAYGRLCDLAEVLGPDRPHDRARLEQFAESARTTEQRWDEARDYATAIAYRWLPETEQRYARQASGLLATAADETVPVELRATAARKAADLLDKVTSVVLPRATLSALEAAAARAIESPAPGS